MAGDPWDRSEADGGSDDRPGGPTKPFPTATEHPAGLAGAVDGGLRASDADRTRTADWLCWAAGTGQLSLDEVDGRLARAYAARTMDDLAVLTADLQPRPEPAPPPAPKPTLRARLGELVPAGYVTRLIPALLITAFVISLTAADGHGWFPWPLLVVAIVVGKHHHRHHHLHGHSRHHRGLVERTGPDR